jgi:hypothetical protein
VKERADERANVRYLVALELMGQNARLRAMILGELGILHDDVGNYRIALGYLLDRDKLPYADNAEGLDVLLSKAQALLHVGKDADAATAADQGLAMIARNPGLAKYRLLALDCAAVYSLAAGRYARALALYTEEIPLLDATPGDDGVRDRLVARVARAAAAVGAGEPARALADLDDVDARLGDPKIGAVLQWPHATADHVVRAYRLISAGLRASANRGLGRLDAEAAAIRTRRDILGEQLGESGREEKLRAQMLTEAQLALNASERHDTPSVQLWLARAVAHAEDLHARAKGAIDKAQLDVLWLAAQLTVSTHATLVPDLGRRIEAASIEMASRREPTFRPYERWFEIYWPLLAPSQPAPAAPVQPTATR